MLSIPIVNVVLLCFVVAGLAFGAGALIGHSAVGGALPPNADPYRYCFHLNLTSNSSLIPAPIRPFVMPGVYAICKIG